MAEPESIERNLLFSCARLAAEFGMARETVAKRIADANVTPAGIRATHPVYKLRDIAPVLLTNLPIGENGERDPRTMSPAERKAWYQSENERVKLETDTRQLIPVAEVQFEMAEIAKGFATFLDTLPNELERDAGLTPEQAEILHTTIERCRKVFYDRVVSEDGEPAAASG